MKDYLRQEVERITATWDLDADLVDALYAVLAEAGGAPDAPLVEPRYADHGLLGSGGTAEVRRVWDTRLGRFVALKRLPRGADETRFVDEVRRTAALSHPGLTLVHDLARGDDGALFCTLREVRGATLDLPIRAVHAASDRHGWGEAADGTTLWDLVDWLQRACEVVGFAHGKGLVHRDLAPANVMIGRRGEVWVRDWGLGSGGEPGGGRTGHVAGNPAYMPPEQAGGAFDSLGPEADVYALGAMLLEITSGVPPYADAPDVLGAVLRGPPTIPPGPPVPADLAAVIEQAMDRRPQGRHPHADALAIDLRAWLRGERRRERGRRLHHQALRVFERAEAAREQALADPEHAEEMERAARLAAADHEQLLHEALAHAPDLVAARLDLLDTLRHTCEDAEAGHDDAEAAVAEAAVRAHTEALPADHPARPSHLAWLRGDGALTLVTDPEGAQATLFRYVEQHRRLVAVHDRDLGSTPLNEVPLARGSWLVVLRKPGHAEVRYPVRIRRQEHWDGVPPGGTRPEAIRLPRADELGPDDIVVPAGWFEAGGDPQAYIALDAVRVWWPAFVIRRHPVTVGEYLGFLEHERAAGGDWEPLVPRAFARRGTDPGQPCFSWSGTRFEPADLGPSVQLGSRHPIGGIDLHCALAFARYERRRTGEAWRLLAELEWEKAARGVDARLFPWGRFLDPTWCRIRATAPQVHSVPIDDHPQDVSPYGVRHMAGNVREWTDDPHQPERDPRKPGLLAPPEPSQGPRTPGIGRFMRGGNFSASQRFARSASRNAYSVDLRATAVGVRLGRTL